MSPALIVAIHDELDTARQLLNRCLDRVSAMAGFPDAGDELAGESRSAQPRRLPPPPLHRGALPPTDED